MARLGSVKNCSVAVDKALLYLLHPAHPDGAPKAAFFARFGYTADNLTDFRMAVADHARDNDLLEKTPTGDLLEQTPTGYGMRYVVRCNLRTPDGRNPCIVTVWIDQGPEHARLVTAYPH